MQLQSLLLLLLLLLTASTACRNKPCSQSVDLQRCSIRLEGQSMASRTAGTATQRLLLLLLLLPLLLLLLMLYWVDWSK